MSLGENAMGLHSTYSVELCGKNIKSCPNPFKNPTPYMHATACMIMSSGHNFPSQVDLTQMQLCDTVLASSQMEQGIPVHLCLQVEQGSYPRVISTFQDTGYVFIDVLKLQNIIRADAVPSNIATHCSHRVIVFEQKHMAKIIWANIVCDI